MDGQWVHQEGIRQISQGIRLHHGRQLQTTDAIGHTASGVVPSAALPEPSGESA